MEWRLKMRDQRETYSQSEVMKQDLGLQLGMTKEDRKGGLG